MSIFFIQSVGDQLISSEQVLQETLKHTHFLMLHDLLNSYKNTIEKGFRLTQTQTG